MELLCGFIGIDKSVDLRNLVYKKEIAHTWSICDEVMVMRYSFYRSIVINTGTYNKS